jgi:hypothetical protein
MRRRDPSIRNDRVSWTRVLDLKCEAYLDYFADIKSLIVMLRDRLPITLPITVGNGGGYASPIATPHGWEETSLALVSGLATEWNWQ